MSLDRSGPTTRSVLDDLPFCLARATVGFRRFNEQTLRAAGLPALAPGKASILHALDEERNCSVSRLIEKTHLPNGTLTGLLDELADEGYVERLSNPLDGRSWLVGLTTKGLRLCKKLRRRHGMVMEVFGEVLSDGQQVELARLLGKVIGCMRGYCPKESDSKSGGDAHRR